MNKLGSKRVLLSHDFSRLPRSKARSKQVERGRGGVGVVQTKIPPPAPDAPYLLSRSARVHL